MSHRESELELTRRKFVRGAAASGGSLALLGAGGASLPGGAAVLAAHYHDFKPFSEFTTGPLNAGTCDPNDLDNTFGPQIMFQKIPAPGQKNLAPSEGMQFFCEVAVSGSSGTLTVKRRDLEGAVLFEKALEPVV